MIFLVTHASRTDEADPVHTNEGLKELTSQIMSNVIALVILHFQISTVCIGKGKRFKESYRAFTQLFPTGMPVIEDGHFGDEVSHRDGIGYILEDGTIVPDEQYIGLSALEGDWWEYLKNKVPDKSIIFTGRQFCECLGVKSRSCSIYAVNPQRKQVVCVIEAGKSLTGFEPASSS